MAAAKSSFPVPVSPKSRIGRSDEADCFALSRHREIASECPRILSNGEPVIVLLLSIKDFKLS